MSNETRNHKDNVFCMLYREKKNLLSLYNAINGTAYENEEELEVVTLEGAICMKIKNDAAFVIDSRLNLYEQQANANRNMPLRDLYYVGSGSKEHRNAFCNGIVRSGRTEKKNICIHISEPEQIHRSGFFYFMKSCREKRKLFVKGYSENFRKTKNERLYCRKT